MEQVTANQLHGRAAGARILDVRETFEFDRGHVPGALNMPMSLVPLRADELDRRELYYIICQSGGRSAQVAAWLERNGFQVANVLGGTDDWIASGLPVVTGRE